MRSIYETYEDVRECMTVFSDGSILPLTDKMEDGSLVALGFWDPYLLQPLVCAFFEKHDTWDNDPLSANYIFGYFDTDDVDDDGYYEFNEVEDIEYVPSGATPVTVVRFPS